MRRWTFTNSNAGSRYFEDFADLRDLKSIDWEAVQKTQWGEDAQIKEKKQAEFLVERCFPWTLVEEIGVYSSAQMQQVKKVFGSRSDVPSVNIHREWYY